MSDIARAGEADLVYAFAVDAVELADLHLASTGDPEVAAEALADELHGELTHRELARMAACLAIQVQAQWSRPGAVVKVDMVADDHHWYWSTHCRHGNCDACAATELAPGVPRRPAQCKTCGAPCQCTCHGAQAA